MEGLTHSGITQRTSGHTLEKMLPFSGPSSNLIKSKLIRHSPQVSIRTDLTNIPKVADRFGTRVAK